MQDSDITDDASLSASFLNKQWNDFSVAMQQKDIAIRTELSRLEQLQRLAEKLHRDCKNCEDQLTSISISKVCVC